MQHQRGGHSEHTEGQHVKPKSKRDRQRQTHRHIATQTHCTLSALHTCSTRLWTRPNLSQLAETSSRRWCLFPAHVQIGITNEDGT
eukprot:2929864-Rhodomonas_salina.1